MLDRVANVPLTKFLAALPIRICQLSLLHCLEVWKYKQNLISQPQFGLEDISFDGYHLVLFYQNSSKIIIAKPLKRPDILLKTNLDMLLKHSRMFARLWIQIFIKYEGNIYITIKIIHVKRVKK